MIVACSLLIPTPMIAALFKGDVPHQTVEPGGFHGR